jgi:DNA-binding response OmpR family regulator
VCRNAQTATASIGDPGRRPGLRYIVRITSLIEQELGCPPLVLVVENDEETRDGIEKLLAADGYRVETARNETDAVDRAARCCPTLILVSLAGSPDQVVAAAVRVRRRADIDASVPVVVFSVPTIDEGAEISLGRNVHITRPDNFDQLRALLGRVILKSLRLV